MTRTLRAVLAAGVLACLAGEQWRVDLFRQGGKIYEASGAKVGGVPYEDLLEHKKRTGQHHPLRQAGRSARCHAEGRTRP